MSGFQVNITAEQPAGTRVRWFDGGTLREVYRVIPGPDSYDWPDRHSCDGEYDQRRWFEYGAGCSAWWTWGDILSQAWATGVEKLNIDRSGSRS